MDGFPGSRIIWRGKESIFNYLRVVGGLQVGKGGGRRERGEMKGKMREVRGRRERREESMKNHHHYSGQTGPPRDRPKMYTQRVFLEPNLRNEIGRKSRFIG